MIYLIKRYSRGHFNTGCVRHYVPDMTITLHNVITLRDIGLEFRSRFVMEVRNTERLV